MRSGQCEDFAFLEKSVSVFIYCSFAPARNFPSFSCSTCSGPLQRRRWLFEDDFMCFRPPDAWQFVCLFRLRICDEIKLLYPIVWMMVHQEQLQIRSLYNTSSTPIYAQMTMRICQWLYWTCHSSYNEYSHYLLLCCIFINTPRIIWNYTVRVCLPLLLYFYSSPRGQTASHRRPDLRCFRPMWGEQIIYGNTTQNNIFSQWVV